jgi:hypothetical protein
MFPPSNDKRLKWNVTLEFTISLPERIKEMWGIIIIERPDNMKTISIVKAENLPMKIYKFMSDNGI